ncbi:hypothetical protein BCR33DRAFT_768632 [Rhizoclosmatium globosum]|uniref:CBM1 domain-containing protein n=1 Tax=Rhizoclosmatium globosum TaxID=329046 RepID=A0A1Y2BY13_9FUNG|nr:hypothetical protein BCR33DRAFT_768632 [Rhizoclosmatium globosum]|eukprot:ORY39662.1 hypothetical protein BCR33DRAFT_768632 [Rhizoclosmatium globosum]
MIFTQAAVLASIISSASAFYAPPHVVKLQQEAGLAPASGSVLTYAGGAVIPNVEVHPIYYGTFEFGTQMSAFYQAITNSVQYDMLAQYNTPTQKIGRGRFVQSHVVTGGNANDPTTIVKALLDSGAVTPNANTYFPIHFGSESDSALGNCQQFCAYHDAFSYNGVDVYYAVNPHCGKSCCASDAFQSLSCVASHELVEATTDAHPPNGWTAPSLQGQEIGDICVGQAGQITGADGVTYVIQKEYSNIDSGCVVGSNLVHGPSTTTAAVKTTTTVPVIKTTTQGAVKTTTTAAVVKTTTQKVVTTTAAGGSGTAAGQSCSAYGSWACSNSLVCSYGAGNNLVWVQVGSVASC